MSESSRRGVRSIFDPESFRKKREDDTISIRKQKREEQNLKRRMLMASSGAAGDATTPAQMASQPLAAPVVTPGATPGAAATTQPVLAKMPVPGSDRFTNPAELLQALQSPDVTLHLQAATHIRRILSIGLLLLLFFSHKNTFVVVVVHNSLFHTLLVVFVAVFLNREIASD